MNDLVAYCQDFISYAMLQHTLSKFKIRKIILYGSAARGDYKKSSDIDLFIDTGESKDAIISLKHELLKVEGSFLHSRRIKKWKLLDINNHFSIIAGDLDDAKWKSLKKSMLLHAYVLWQRYTESKDKLKPFALVK